MMEIVKINEPVSNKMSNMGMFCMLIVVLIHITRGTAIDLTRHIGWERIIFGDTIGWVAVPSFFIMSGFFLAGHFEEDGWYWREVTKRIRSLMIPFIIWASLYLVFDTCVGLACDWYHARPKFATHGLVDDSRILESFGLDFSKGTYLNVLWYIRTLFCLTILAPFFNPKNRIFFVLLALSVVLYVLEQCQALPNAVKLFFSTGPVKARCVAYYMMGIGLRYYGLPHCMHRLWAGCLALLLWFGEIVVLYLAYKGIIHFEPLIRMLFIPTMIYLIWCVTPERPSLSFLTRLTFPVFFVHMFAVQICICLMGIAKGYNYFYWVVYALAVLVLTISICMALRIILPKP